MSFTYDLVLLKSYPCGDINCCNGTNCWKVIEIGPKSPLLTRHEICYNTLISARNILKDLIKEHNLNTLRCFQSPLLRNHGFILSLKSETYQPLQSVKGRGVMYTLSNLSEEQKRKGVISISTGSFAYILCYYGKMFNIPVTVVMPRTVSIRHVRMCRDTGSLVTVIIHGDDILEAHSYALRKAQFRGLFYLDGNDHPHMIIGQATLGLEIVEEVENIDAVILPTVINGDCGLTAGIAMAIKRENPKIKIIKVRPADCDPLVEKIRSQTMSMEESTILSVPPEKYKWENINSSELSKQIMFDHYIKTNQDSVTAFNNQYHRHLDYHTAIAITAFDEGIINNVLNKLKAKRVVIPVFGEMDRSPMPRSDPSVPRAGP